jgi:hypothetical protein
MQREDESILVEADRDMHDTIAVGFHPLYHNYVPAGAFGCCNQGERGNTIMLSVLGACMWK